MSRERERLEDEDEIRKRIKREMDAKTTAMVAPASYNHQMMGRRHMLGPPASAGSCLNTVTPCAACKLLRRRCAEECPFSPYFSPHDPQKFAAVHKVFGASNVSKMLMEVPDSQRADAANSLVYEANVRLRDPVYGCMGAISALQQQVQTLQAELNAVRAEIFRYKYREAANTLISATTLATSTPAAAALPQVQSPQQPTPPPPPATPPPPTSRLVLLPSSSPTVASLYTPPPSSTSTATFASLSSDHRVSYFD